MVYAQVTVKSWEEFRALTVGHENWVYRGQSDAEWSLQTTLERAVSYRSQRDILLVQAEQVALERFQRRAHHYIASPPPTAAPASSE